MATTPANSTNTKTTGQVSFSGTAFSGSTLTQYSALVGGASNAITSVGPGTAGQVLQSGGASANPSYSTATYPSTAGTAGNILTSDGTNWTTSTTYSITSGTFTPAIRGSGTAGTPTYVRQLGYYQTVGSYVTVIIDLSWSALTGASGTLQVSNLPFTSKTAIGFFSKCAEGWGTDSQTLACGSGNIPSSMIGSNSTSINVNYYSTVTGQQAGQPLGSGSLVWTLTYTI